MSHRIQLPILISFLSVISGFTAFFLTKSQPQFTAYNLLLVCLAGAVGLIALGFEAFGSHQKTKSKKSAPGRELLLSLGSVIAICFLAWTWISTAFSGRFTSALFGVPTSLLGLVAIVALACIALSAYRFSEEFSRIFSMSAPLIGLITSVWAFVLDASIDAAGNYVDSAHIGFANSSELALFLLILLPWTLSEKYPLFKNSPQVEKALRLIAAAALVYTAYWTQARMALILMVLVLVEYALSNTSLGMRVRARIVGLVYAAVLVVAGLVAVLESTGILSTSLFSIRGRLWRIGLEVVFDSPLFGAGADGYQLGAIKLANFANSLPGTPLVFGDGTSSPHNILVDVMTSFGAVGLLLAIAGIVLFVFYVGRSKSYETFGPHTGSPAIVATVSAFLLLCTMPSTLNLLGLVLISAGVALNTGSVPKPLVTLNSTFTRNFRLVALVLASCVVILGIFDASVRLSLGPVHYYRPATLSKALNAASLQTIDPYFALQANTAVAFTPLDAKARKTTAEAFKSIDTEKALKADHQDPYLALSRANALAALGEDPSKIEELYLEAISRYPGFPDGYAFYADWLAQQGRTQDALEAIMPVLVFQKAGLKNWDMLIDRVQDSQK